MTKRSAAQERNGPEWVDLFDPTYAESSCDAVRVAIAEAASGGSTAMHTTLRRHLVRPLEQYTAAHHREGHRIGSVIAAANLIETAERLADRFADRWPFDAEDAEPAAHRLYVGWLEFIAHACGPLAYHSEPRRLRQTWDAARQPRGRARELSPESLAAWMKARAMSALSEAVADDLAARHRVSRSTVYRRLKAARAAGLVS